MLVTVHLRAEGPVGQQRRPLPSPRPTPCQARAAHRNPEAARGGGPTARQNTKTQFFPWQAAHKAVLAVSEEGTEAAAATATQLSTRSKDSSSRSICFNRPFLMLIVHQASGSLLFLGKVEDPMTF